MKVNDAILAGASTGTITGIAVGVIVSLIRMKEA